jgi:hypothetical protein
MGTSPSPDSAERATARDRIGAQFQPLIDQLDLEPLQYEFLRRRWLDQVRWAEDRAASSQRWYNRLRLLTIVGGVVIPALVGLNVTGPASERIRWTVFGLGLLVALAAAIEGFFHYSDRWPHHRRTAELLKSEGWQFFQLSGQYADAATHAGAYPRFAAQVEALIQRDVEIYFTAVVAEQPQPGKEHREQNERAPQAEQGLVDGRPPQPASPDA